VRYLLALLIICVTAADVFSWSVSLAPGVSVKNGMIYLILLALAARFVVRGGMRMEVPRVHLWFGILIAYATLTWLVAGIVIRYRTYNLLSSGFDLKIELYDNAIILGMFLYGTRTVRDAEFLLKCMLLAVAIANAIAIGDAAGVFNIGVTVVGSDGNHIGRIYGAFGHANETAALILCLLPAYIAATLSAGRAATGLWALAGATSGTLLLLTGSRGAFVGLALTAIFGSYICRNLVSWRRAARVALTLGAVAIPLCVFASMKLGGVLFHRIAEMFLTTSASDDRTQIWGPVLDQMMASPLTLITGFGWGAYDAVGAPMPTHNHYLMLWFELGIIGVGSFVLFLRALVITSIRAVRNAPDETGRYLVAFIYGVIGLAGVIFFTPLYRPWLYIYAYIGLMMRMAVIAMQTMPAKVRNEHRYAPALRSSQAVAQGLPTRVARAHVQR
jgi:O-antigen ligase